MATRPVQFRGIPAVLRAYENAGIAPFSIKCDKQLLMKFEDDDLEGGKQLLQSALKELSTGGALATYTLCVYEDLKPKEKIKGNTPYDMSFNFKVEEYEETQARRYSSQDYETRIAGLEEKINSLTEPDETEPEAVGGIWGTIGKLLEHPDVSAAIAGKIVSVIHSVGGSGAVGASLPAIVPAAKVAGAGDRHDSEQMEKIKNAVNTLSRLDPNLGDHLVRIAEIAMKEPSQYKLFIEMLTKT